MDVATFDQREESGQSDGTSGGTATALETWAPPLTALTFPVVFPDDIELQVFDTEGGFRLVTAVELASPGNKDRPDARRGFAAKCLAYLQRGVGVVVVDGVTVRQQNLHNELAQIIGIPDVPRYPSESLLYAAAYRPSG